MHVSDLVHHVRYNAWASRKCLDKARGLSHEQLTRPFETAHPSLLETLVHIFQADDAWYSRISGAARLSPFNPAEPVQLAILDRDWLPLLDRYTQMADGLDEQGWDRVVAYHNLKGEPGQHRVRHILLHLVNHDSFHRGQVSAMLRQLGHKPDWIDLMAYYREVGV